MNFDFPQPFHRFSSKHTFSVVSELILLPITFWNSIALIKCFFDSALFDHFEFSIVFQFYQELSLDSKLWLNLNIVHSRFVLMLCECPVLAAFKCCSPVFEITPFMSLRRPYSFCLCSSVVLVA